MVTYNPRKIINVWMVKSTIFKKSPQIFFFGDISVYRNKARMAQQLGPGRNAPPPMCTITHPSHCIMGSVVLLWKHPVQAASQTGNWTWALFCYNNNHRQSCTHSSSDGVCSVQCSRVVTCQVNQRHVLGIECLIISKCISHACIIPKV